MSRSKRRNTITVAFYNVENLFDTVNNPLIADHDYTPMGKKNWNSQKYQHKIRKITSVIRQIGENQSSYPPALVGLVEVENAKVVKDLTYHKNLSKYNYSYVHYDSPDERGIDVALLYNKDFFEIISTETFPLDLTDSEGVPDYTRDLLVVKGKLNGELIHVLVNHWPSRRDGDQATNKNRIKAAELVQEVMQNIKFNEPEAKFIIMGDFNDDPTNDSIKNVLVTDDLYNPMRALFEKGQGSSTYYGEWHLFDQIMFSRSFFDTEKSQHTFLKAAIYNKDWLRFYKGKFKGSPFRTYIGPWYQGGYSDHFPVYITFEKS